MPLKLPLISVICSGKMTRVPKIFRWIGVFYNVEQAFAPSTGQGSSSGVLCRWRFRPWGQARGLLALFLRFLSGTGSPAGSIAVFQGNYPHLGFSRGRNAHHYHYGCFLLSTAHPFSVLLPFSKSTFFFTRSVPGFTHLQLLPGTGSLAGSITVFEDILALSTPPRRFFRECVCDRHVSWPY